MKSSEYKRYCLCCNYGSDVVTKIRRPAAHGGREEQILQYAKQQSNNVVMVSDTSFIYYYEDLMLVNSIQCRNNF